MMTSAATERPRAPLARLLWRHLGNELRRAFYLQRRYWFEALLGVAMVLGLFGGLVLAVLSATGKGLDSGEADGLIVGFVVWLFAAAAFQSASNDVQQETEQRTLEQLCLAPLPLWALLSLRALLQVGGGLLLLLPSLLLLEWLTDGRLPLPYGPVLGATLLAAPALIGLGYAVAGLLLLVKRGELMMAATFPLVIGLVALPAYPLNALAGLPYALGAAAARAAAAGAQLPPAVYGWILLNSVAYLLLGLVTYAVLERRARRLGVLGHF
ncbi:hypothetical protein G8A07_27570 [Roseateles sp. DAIF2]|uniref:hypothetical protein n=1 Tax=Roseateles sp. DAIF2 TaxID=2714952 RepID=UPI0018A2C687|nr:hypothetical protein [Roseateles sp. DAIF2]QPF76321.1 hypothetical protein G8A07_27570 [Roseateles sp. DAIF2]